MARLEELEKEFDKYFFNMYYDEAMQVVGKMKQDNHTGKARYCEVLIYYEQGKYEKVRNTFRNKRIDNVYERELYVCSLLELQLYDEFFKEYENMEPVSQYCIAYMGGLMIAQGMNKEKIKELGNKDALVESHTFMERRYKWFVSNAMADIYLLNEEKMQMIDAGMDEGDIKYLRDLIDRKFESIRIIDPYKEEVKDLVEKDKRVDIYKILWFPVAYCGKKDKVGINPIQSFNELYDIVNYLELCRRIDYSAVELDAFTEYGKKLFDGVRDGNPYVIELMKKIYIDVSFYERYEINDKRDTVADVICSQLKKYAPYVFDDIENHSQDRRITSILSTKGQIAYKAALWQFENAVSSNYGTIDAGMLCLSYMRILELEINERIINRIRADKAVIRECYDSFIRNLSSDEQEKHKKTWDYVINVLTDTKNNNLELGPVYTFFDILRNKKFKKNNSDSVMADSLRNMITPVLTENGIKALADGSLAKMVEPKVRNKYRNPPAHTRYVRLEIAFECREYVMSKLLVLNSYIRE